uniref:Galactosyltransferase C-terminal domain-containing protein n=1 Tax=viral metagenome TaxID=1070528 RepID=A0A6C0E0S1_9ZZZZ
MTTIPKLIFIVPYRDRLPQKQHFSIYMKYIMEDYNKDDYEIYYSHQTDSRMFNRGATKNIGFLAIKEKYPNDYKNITIVFNDVDTLPSIKNMFDYITHTGIVKHFYGFTFALGGIVSITGEDFEKCNGFPNNWGWGLEDNALNNRVLERSIIINRDQFIPINNPRVIHLFDNPNRIINVREPALYINNELRDNLDSIYGLAYTIVDSQASNLMTNENSNKLTEIKQNEYIINIHQFLTLIKENNNTFYSQNLIHEPTLAVNKTVSVKKRYVKPRWLLNNNYM